MLALLLAAFLLAGRLYGCPAEATDRVREVLRHDIVVHIDGFAVERDVAFDTMAFVQVGGGQDVSRANLGAGDREAVQSETDDGVDADIVETAAERVVVVLAADLRVATA